MYELHVMGGGKKKKSKDLVKEWKGYMEPGSAKAAFIKYKVNAVELVDFQEEQGCEVQMSGMTNSGNDFDFKYSMELSGDKTNYYYRLNIHSTSKAKIEAVKKQFLDSFKRLE